MNFLTMTTSKAPVPTSKAAQPVNPRVSQATAGELASVQAHIATDPESPLPPLTQLRRIDTHRLLPAKYGVNYESVLTRIADNDEHLQLIFELDNATNARLEAEENLRPGITQRELVFQVPHYRIINAAFTHPNPLGARFSTPERGAWYAAFEIATAKAEVLFHKSLEFAEIDWQEREEMQYDEYLADFAGSFHDLRNDDLHSKDSFQPCLDPGSYVASQMLTAELLAQGSLGIVYPSVRRDGGTCIACFRPSVVANVRKASRYRLVWTKARATLTREGF